MGSTIDKNASTSQSKAVIPEIGHEYMKMKKKSHAREITKKKNQHFVP